MRSSFFELGMVEVSGDRELLVLNAELRTTLEVFLGPSRTALNAAVDTKVWMRGCRRLAAVAVVASYHRAKAASSPSPGP